MARTKPPKESRHDRYLATLAESANLMRERAITTRELAEAREITVMSARKHLADLEGLGCIFETFLAYANEQAATVPDRRDRKHVPRCGPKAKHFKLVLVPAGALPVPVEG